MALHSLYCADEKTLLHLYRSLIRSKLEYGAVMYGCARKSYLRMLDPIQNQALRTCLDAFRTSPVTSLHVEAKEMPVDLRCRMLSSEYCSNTTWLAAASSPLSSLNSLIKIQIIYVHLVSMFLPIYLILGLPRKIIYLPLFLLLPHGILFLQLLIYL